MRRLHLFEFSEMLWCPRLFRETIPAYIRLVTHKMGTYEPVMAQLVDLLRRTGERRIVDLCSEGPGDVEWIRSKVDFPATLGGDVHLTLAARTPQRAALELRASQAGGQIAIADAPVDPAQVPAELEGVRTIFSSYHSQRPEEARATLQDAVDHGVPIAVFEGISRNLATFIWILFCTPLVQLFVIPFVKPFRVERLLFTYVIPLIPLMTLWDAVVSVLRVYSVPELHALVAQLDADAYRWEIGQQKELMSGDVTYLIGWPEGTGAG